MAHASFGAAALEVSAPKAVGSEATASPTPSPETLLRADGADPRETVRACPTGHEPGAPAKGTELPSIYFSLLPSPRSHRRSDCPPGHSESRSQERKPVSTATRNGQRSAPRYPCRSHDPTLESVSIRGLSTPGDGPARRGPPTRIIVTDPDLHPRWWPFAPHHVNWLRVRQNHHRTVGEPQPHQAPLLDLCFT